MNGNLILAFAGFALVSSITPGPNNAALLASGANHGFVRTLPHLFGVTGGCVVMLVLVGLGLDRVFAAVPALYEVLRYVGAAYLLWLAWRIAGAGPMKSGRSGTRPMNVLQAMAFQWVNPKAWMMIVGALATYAPREDFLRSVVVIALVLAPVNASSLAVWAGGGAALRRLLDRPWRVRVFNVSMAGLLVLSLYPLLRD